MRVLVTGATGLIGSALCAALRARGDTAVPLRRGPRATDAPTWDPPAGHVDLAPAGDLDAVVHLAGATIGRRWTARYRQVLHASRVAATAQLVATLATLPVPPATFIAASASGVYGDRGDELLTEHSALGSGFLATLGRDWEAAATPLAEVGTRLVWARFGVVMAPAGGMLAQLRPLFRLGLGGRLGSGRQHMAWVALDDAVAVLLRLLDAPTLAGPFNVVAPEAVTNAEFTRAYAAVLHRPAPWAVPAWVLRLAMGEMADELLLGGQRVEPERLRAAGFAWRYPTLAAALAAAESSR